jgi:uncharacterized protein (DUF433 family)
MVAKSLDRFIEMTPDVMGGVPRIAGHRVRVSDVAIWHERLKWDAETIVTEIGLTLPEIYAALSFYFDHRDEIDQQIASDDAYHQEMKKQQQPLRPSSDNGGA